MPTPCRSAKDLRMQQLAGKREGDASDPVGGEDIARVSATTISEAAPKSHGDVAARADRSLPRRSRRLGWAGVAISVTAGAMLAVSGHPAMGALAGATSMVAAGWMLGHRGRVHRWPMLLKDARHRDAADE